MITDLEQIDVQWLLDNLLPELLPAQKSKDLAEFSDDQIKEIKEENKRALGTEPRYTTTVDGHEGAPLSSVQPDGVVVTEFHLVTADVLPWIADQLEKHSPVGKTHRYIKSHRLMADGQQVDDIRKAPQAARYVFVNVAPYARKIERGSSSQAPDGVYQAVAALARLRFGNIADIEFTEFEGDLREPAIVVKVRDA